MIDKKLLTAEELDSQAVLELPDRQMLTWYRLILVDIRGNDILNVDVDVSDVNVALALCVYLLAKTAGANECRIQQH